MNRKFLKQYLEIKKLFFPTFYIILFKLNTIFINFNINKYINKKKLENN